MATRTVTLQDSAVGARTLTGLDEQSFKNLSVR